MRNRSDNHRIPSSAHPSRTCVRLGEKPKTGSAFRPCRSLGQNWGKRATAAVLALVYFLGNVALSHAAETNLWDQRRHDLSDARRVESVRLASLPSVLVEPLPSAVASLSPSPLRNRSRVIHPILSALSSPEGSVREIWAGASNGAAPVVLIQDVHLNSEAQERVSGLIMAVQRIAHANGGRALVGVEGAFGMFDFRRYLAFPDRKLTEAVAGFFLENNMIAAPSYVGMTQPDAPQFFGIDDRHHYDENVQAYRASLPLRSRVVSEVERLSKIVDGRKQGMNPRMRQFDAYVTGYAKGGMGLAAFLRGLHRLAGRAADEEGRDLVVEQFLAACDLEAQMDFAKVDREKSEALRLLSERANPEDLRVLAGAAVSYRSGRLSYADFFGALHGILERNNVPIERMPAFDSYLRYVALSDGINASRLFASVRAIERRTLAAVADGNADVELMERSRELTLAEKISDFSLTPDEWQEYKQRFLTLGEEKPQSGLEKDFAALRARLSTFENFYRAADARSAQLVENLIQEQSREKAPVSAMVIGGFHTPLVAQYLRGRGIPYAIVQVRLTKVQGLAGSEYLSVFSRDKTPLDRLLAGERLFLAPLTLAVGSNDAAVRPAELKVRIPLAVASKTLPRETGVTRTEIAPNVFQLDVDGTSVTVAKDDARLSGRREIGSMRVPGVGLLRYMADRPSVREWWFVLLPLLFIPFMGTGVDGLLASFMSAAFTFAAVHDNKWDGRFSVKTFLVRALGTFGLLGAVWSLVVAAGLLAPAILAVPTFSLVSFVGLGAMILGGVILHEAWLRFAPARYALSVRSGGLTPEMGPDASAYLALLRVFPAVREIMVPGPENALERNAVIVYFRNVFGVAVDPSVKFDVSARVIRAIQSFERERFEALAAAAFDEKGEAGIVPVRREIQRRLNALAHLYDQSAPSADEVISAYYGGEPLEVWRPRRRVIDLRAKSLGRHNLEFLVSSAQIGREQFRDAETRGDLNGMAMALDDMPHDVSKSAMTDRFETALSARLVAATTPQQAAAIGDSLPPSFREPAIVRAAELANERILAATTVTEIEENLPFLPDTDPRRDAAQVKISEINARPVTPVIPEPTVEEPVAVVPRPKIKVKWGADNGAAFQRELVAARASTTLGPLIAATGAERLTNDEWAMLTLYLGKVNGGTAVGRIPSASMSARLVTALRSYELSLFRADALARTVDEAMTETLRRRNALIKLIDGFYRSDGDALSAALMSDVDVISGTQHARVRGRDVDIPVIVTTQEMAEVRFQKASAAGDLKTMAAIIAKTKERGLKSSRQDRYREVIAANLPGITSQAELATLLESLSTVLEGVVPESLRTQILQRRIALAIEALSTDLTAGEAEEALSLVPAADARRPEAEKLEAGIAASRRIRAAVNRLAVLADDLALVAALGAHPARQATLNYLKDLDAEKAREAFARARADRSLADMREEMAKLPDVAEQVAMEAAIHDVALLIVRDAHRAADISDEVLDALPPADRAAALRNKDILQKSAGIPAADEAMTPRDRLRAFQKLFRERRSKAGSGTDLRLFPAVAAYYELLRLAQKLDLLRVLGMKPAQVVEVRKLLRDSLDEFLRRSNRAGTLSAFETALTNLIRAFRALQRRGLGAEFGVPADGKIDELIPKSRLVAFRRQVAPALAALKTAADGVALPFSAEDLIDRIQNLQINEEGTINREDEEPVLRVVRNARSSLDSDERPTPAVAVILDALSELESALMHINIAEVGLASDSKSGTAASRAPPVTRVPLVVSGPVRRTPVVTPPVSAKPAVRRPAPKPLSSRPRANWLSRVAALFLIGVLGGAIAWFTGAFDRPLSPRKSPTPSNVSVKDVIRPGPALPPIWNADRPSPDGIARLDPTAGWRNASDRKEAARADMVDLSLRSLALTKGARPADAYAAEIPQLARGRAGVPIQTLLFVGRPHLLLDNGNTMPITREMLNEYERRGYFLPPAGRTFVTLDLSNATFAEQNIMGEKAPVVRFAARGALVVNGKNVIVPAIPIGIDGNPIVAAADPLSRPTFHSVARRPLIGLQQRQIDPATGETVWFEAVEIPASLSPSDFRHYNRVTGNPILFLRPEDQLKQGKEDLALLNQRLGVLKELAERGDIVAVEVNEKGEIVERFKTHADVPAFVFYRRDPKTLALTPYLPSDLTVDQSREPDMIRRAEMKGGAVVRDGGGLPVGKNQILFALNGDLSVTRATKNAKSALDRSTGVWAMASKVTAAEEARTFIGPVYMVIHDKVNDSYGFISSKIITDYQLQMSGLRIQMLQNAGFPPLVIMAMQNNNQVATFFADGKMTELKTPAIDYITNDSPEYETTMLAMFAWQRANASLMATHHRPDGQIIASFKADRAGDDVALQKLIRNPRRTNGNIIILKDGTYVTRNIAGVVLATQVSEDFGVRHRVFWSNNAIDVRDLAALKALAPLQKNDFGQQVNFVDGAIDAKAKNPLARFAQNKTWLIAPTLAYEVDATGRITVENDPVALHTRLYGPGSSKLLYVLADGTIVRWYELTGSEVITEVRDPAKKTSIFTGSEWLRMRYEIEVAAMTEQIIRPGRNHIGRQIIIPTIKIGGITLQAATSFNASAVVQSEVARAQFKRNIAQLARKVEDNPALNAAQKLQAMEQLRKMAQDADKGVFMSANGAQVIIKSSDLDMIQWRARLLRGMTQQQEYERILASGGIVVTTNGDVYGLSAQLEQLYQSWGGHRSDEGIQAFPAWVPGDVDSRKDLQFVMGEFRRDIDAAMLKNPPQTRFVVNGPAAPVAVASQLEYRKYIADLRTRLPKAEADVRAASAKLDAAVGRNAIRDARRDLYRARIGRDILIRQISDSERPGDVSAPQRQQYVRTVMVKGAAVEEHVTIITPAASAFAQLRDAQRLAARRAADLALERKVEEKGGVIVRAPDGSTYHVAGEAADVAPIALWRQRMTDLLTERVAEERDLTDQWSGLRPGRERDDLALQIRDVQSQIEQISRNQVFIWTERGVVRVIEIKHGTAAAKDQVDRLTRVVAETPEARKGVISGAVVTVPKAGGLPTVSTLPADVELRQRQLGDAIEKAQREYRPTMDWLSSNRADHPQAPALLARAKVLARQIREATTFEDANNVYHVLNGFHGGEHQLRQLLRERLRDNEVLVEEVDMLGVPTGRSVVWSNDTGVWKESKLHEPITRDAAGLPRTRVSDIVRTEVNPANGARVYITGGKTQIDTLEVAQIRAPGTDELFLATRPVLRESLRFVTPAPIAGNPNRLIETWTRTTFTYVDANSEIVLKSVTVNFTRVAGANEDTAVVDARPVMTRNARMEAGKAKRVDGSIVYDVVYGPGAGRQMDGQRREVHVDPVTGIDNKTFYPLNGPLSGEVAIRTSEGVYEIRPYVNGVINMAGLPAGTIRDTRIQVNGGSVHVRTEPSGRFVEAYSIDESGRQVASFHHRPEVINGRAVYGRVVLDGNQTTADLAKLPQGREIIAARGYPDPALRALPVKQVFYFDEKFHLFDADGRELRPDQPATNPVALAVQTGDRFDRGAAEFYGAELPGNWVMVEEVRLAEDPSVVRNRFFDRARAVDPFGRERASVAALPDGRFLVEFVNPTAAEAGKPIRVTYTADRRPAAGAEPNRYALERTAISTTFIHERPLPLNNLAAADWVIDGGADLPDPIRSITSMVPSKTEQREDMRRRLHLALRSTANDLKVPGPLTLVVTAVQVRDGGISYTVRVKEDPFGRIIMFYSNENVIVNTSWKSGNGTEGFEYAKGLTFRIEASAETITAAELMQAIPYDSKTVSFDAGIVTSLRKNRIQTGADMKLSRVTRYLRPDAGVAPGAGPNEEEIRRGEVRVDSRYVMVGDPLVRNYAVESAGFIRFIRWGAPGVPFGVSGGEIVVNVRGQEFVRNTYFARHDGVTGQYEYDVVNDPLDPRYLPLPEEARKSNPDKIVFNYTNNMVFEIHSAEGYAVASRDGFFLYTYHINDNERPSRQTVTALDGNKATIEIPYWDERHPSARLYSEFTTRTWQSPERDIYILISEEIVPGATEGTTSPTSYLIKNGQLVAKIEGRINDPNAFVKIDLGEKEDLWLSFYRKYYNSIPGLIANTVQREILGEPTVRDVMQKILDPKEGRVIEFTQRRPPMKPSFNPVRAAIQNAHWIGAGVIALFLSIGGFLGLRRRLTPAPKSRSEQAFGKSTLTGLYLGRESKVRFAELELLTRQLVVPQSVKKEDRAAYVRNYFVWNGFTEGEAKVIADRYSRGALRFDNEEPDLKSEPAVPELDELNAVRQIYLGHVGSYKDMTGVERKGKPFARAVVLRGLRQRGLISDAEIVQAVRAVKAGSGYSPEGAILWEGVTNRLINQAQENFLRRSLRKPAGTTLSADEIAARNAAIDNLPLTAEANVLRALIHAEPGETPLVSMDDLAADANGHNKMGDFVNALLIRHVIDPVIETVFAGTFRGILTDEVKQDVRDSIIADVLPFIYKNPGLAQEFLRKGDLTYNAHPMVKAIEPTTLREFALLKFIQLNPSQTQRVGGQMGAAEKDFFRNIDLNHLRNGLTRGASAPLSPAQFDAAVAAARNAAGAVDFAKLRDLLSKPGNPAVNGELLTPAGAERLFGSPVAGTPERIRLDRVMALATDAVTGFSATHFMSLLTHNLQPDLGKTEADLRASLVGNGLATDAEVDAAVARATFPGTTGPALNLNMLRADAALLTPALLGQLAVIQLRIRLTGTSGVMTVRDFDAAVTDATASWGLDLAKLRKNLYGKLPKEITGSDTAASLALAREDIFFRAAIGTAAIDAMRTRLVGTGTMPAELFDAHLAAATDGGGRTDYRKLKAALTKKAHYSVGQYSAMWPFSMYLVRLADRALKAGSSQVQVLEMIDDVASTIIPTVRENIVKAERITSKRNTWMSPEEMTVFGIKAALMKRAPAGGVLGALDGTLRESLADALQGILSDPLRAATAAEVKIVLDAADAAGTPRDADAIVEIVHRNLLTELSARDPRIRGLLDAVRRDMDRQQKNVPLSIPVLSDVLRAETLLEISRAVGAMDAGGGPRDVDAILDIVQRNMERELAPSNARVHRSVDAVRRELQKRIPPSARMAEIEPLFNGRPEAAELTAFVRDALNEAEQAGRNPDVDDIVAGLVLSDQKLVDLFIDLNLWDLFEFIQDKSEAAVAAGRPPVLLEDEVTVGTAGSVKDLRKLAEGDQENKDKLSRALQEKTLELSDEIHPESTAMDRGTKRTFGVREFPLVLSVVILIAGIAAGFSGLLTVTTTVGVAVASLIMLFTSIRLSGTGLIALYLRIPRALSSLSGFWNMNAAQRIGYVLSSAVVLVASVAIVSIWPGLFAVGVALGLTIFTILPIVWAGNFPFRERLFFGAITGTAGAYVGGLLTYNLFWKLAVIDPFTFGFVTTLVLLLLTVIPTLISTYHLMLAARSYYFLNAEVWSDRARGITGWRSLNPLRGFLRAFASNRVSFREFRNAYLGAAMPVYLFGAAAAFLVTPLSFLIFTAAFLVIAVVLYQILRSVKSRMQADVADFWEITYTNWFAELRDVERTRTSLLANGETVGRYLERLAQLLNRKFLLSDDELKAWRAAARGEKGGRFLKPRSAKAEELLRDAFNAISQRKPLPDVAALMQASSTHVQAAGELFTHTFENCAMQGTFNTRRDGKPTTLLGYVARTHPDEWKNFIERVFKQTHERFGRTPRAVIALAGIDEVTDLYHLLYRRYSDADFTSDERAFVIGLMMDWMNEMRPNNRAVIESMGQDKAEYHMLLSNERASLRDSAYRQAADEISLRAGSFSENFQILATRHAALFRLADELRRRNPVLAEHTMQELTDHLAALRAAGALPGGSQAALFLDQMTALDAAGRTEVAFVEFYPVYSVEVGLKLRSIFQDATIWNLANFTADSDGKNIVNVGGLQALIKEMSVWAARLPAGDPVKDELLGRDAARATAERTAITGLIPLLQKFDPKAADLTPADRTKFATMEAWSAEFLAWRDRTEPGSEETNGERMIRLMSLFSATADAGLVAVRTESPDSVLSNSLDLRNQYLNLIQLASVVIVANANGVRYAFHDIRADNLAGGKHPGIGSNLWRFYGRTVDYDAHVMVDHGQNAFRPFWAAMNSQQRNPQYAAINPKMVVWASLSEAFPGTNLYSIAQTVWTSDVQRALRNMLLDYGKYMGIPQTVGPFTPPGEDSQGLLMLQRSAARKGVFYTGTQIDWFTYRWGRPSLFAESLAMTEMRYAFNVTVFLASRGSYSVFFNRNIPVQVKLVHLFLWMHYLIAPFALALLILLPALSPFSAFAFLKPFFFFVMASFILMQAINVNNFIRHWREEGNAWVGAWLTAVDLVKALPMYVSLIPFFFRGVWLAADEMFSFIRTEKQAYLAALPEWQRYDSFMMFQKTRFAIPLNALFAVSGLIAFLMAVLMMTPYGPVILSPFPAASLAMLIGISSIGAFHASTGLRGYRYELPSAMLTGVSFLGWITALILVIPLGAVAWTVFGVLTVTAIALLARYGHVHRNGVVRMAWAIQRSFRSIPLNYYLRFAGFVGFVAGIALVSHLGILSLLLYFYTFPRVMAAVGWIADKVDPKGTMSRLDARRRAAEKKALDAGLEPEVARIARLQPDLVDRLILEYQLAQERLEAAAEGVGLESIPNPRFDPQKPFDRLNPDAPKREDRASRMGQQNEWAAKKEIEKQVAKSDDDALARARRLFRRGLGALTVILFVLMSFFNAGAVNAQAPLDRAAIVRLINEETGALKPLQSQKQAGEFIDLQRMGEGRPKPALPATFHVPTKGAFKYVNADHKLIVERGVGLYDTSLDVLTYVELGRNKEAREILETYASGRYGEYQLGAFPTKDNGGSFAPFDEKTHFLFNFTDVTGKYTPKWSFWNVHTGPNAWLVIAAVRFLDANGGMDAPENRSIRDLVNRISGAMLLMQSADGGMRYGPKGQYDAAAGKNTDAAFNYFNMENNVSAYSAYRSLQRFTGDKKWGDAAEGILKFMTETQVWVQDDKGEWVSQRGFFNKAEGILYMGAVWNADRRRYEVERQFATDSAGSWTIQSIGIARFDELFGKGAAYRAYVAIRAKAGRTAAFAPTRPGDRLAGIDFTDRIGDRAVDGDSGLHSREWGAAFARRGADGRMTDGLLISLIDFYAKNPVPEVTPAVMVSLKADHDSLIVGLYTNPNPYADGPGLKNWRGRIGVGFNGGSWIPPAEDFTATASLYLFFQREPLAWWRNEAMPRLPATVEPVVESVRPVVPVNPPEAKKEPVNPAQPKTTEKLAETPTVIAPIQSRSNWARLVWVVGGLVALSGIVFLVIRLFRRGEAVGKQIPTKMLEDRGDSPYRRALQEIQRGKDLYASAVALLPKKTEGRVEKVDTSAAALLAMTASIRGDVIRLLVEASRAYGAAIASLDVLKMTLPEAAERLPVATRERVKVQKLLTVVTPAMEDDGAVPGALGLWARLGLRDLGRIGRYEGWISAVVMTVALWVTGDPMSLIGLGAALLSTIIFFTVGHAAFGVDTGRGTPRRSVALVLRATQTASQPLVFLPLIALGLMSGGFIGGLVAIVGAVLIGESHAALNRRSLVSPALRKGARAIQSGSLDDLISIEQLGLNKFGRAAGRDRAEQMAEAFGFDRASGATMDSIRDRFFWLNGVALARPANVQTVGDSLVQTRRASADGADQDLFVPAPAVSVEALLSDINKYRALTGNERAAVLLVGENERFVEAVQAQSLRKGAATLIASSIVSGTDLSRRLEQAGASLRHLRVLVHRNVVLPDNILAALIQLGHRSESPVAVDMLILAALTAEALSIRVGVEDMDGLVRFRRLVATQA